MAEQLSQLFIRTAWKENDWDNRATMGHLHGYYRSEDVTTNKRQLLFRFDFSLGTLDLV